MTVLLMTFFYGISNIAVAINSNCTHTYICRSFSLMPQEWKKKLGVQVREDGLQRR